MRWLLVLALAGCAAVERPPHPLEPAPVPGWPVLQEVVRVAAAEEAFQLCAGRQERRRAVGACARVDLPAGLCEIVLVEGYPPAFQRWALAEERKHCRGHDHLGEGTFRAMLEEWVRAGRPQVAVVDYGGGPR